MTHFIKELQEQIEVLDLMPTLKPTIIEPPRLVAKGICNGGKLMLIGNGGYVADSQHLAAEFIGRFINDGRALPGIALTVDTSALTCVAND